MLKNGLDVTQFHSGVYSETKWHFTDIKAFLKEL